MSETKDPRRARRRASRTAGPPVESAANEPALERTGTGSSATETPHTLAESGRDVRAGETAAAETKAADSATGNETAGVAAETSDSETVAVGTGAEPAGAASGTVRLEKAGAVRLDKKKSEQAGSGASAGRPDSSGEDESAAAGPEPAGGAWGRVLALTAAAVLVLGLVGAAVVSVLAVQSTQQRDERRSEYVATARQTILNLTTIRADTAKEDIDRILTLASGEFRTEFDGRVDPFTEIVKQAKVVSTGEVVEAAVEREEEDSAVVLVAAKQTLTNAGSAEQQQRFYRFRVTVSRADDGTLTASDVEFVA